MRGKIVTFLLVTMLVVVTAAAIGISLALESLKRHMVEAIWDDLSGIGSFVGGRSGLETLPGLLADVTSAIRLTGAVWGADGPKAGANHALCNLRWAIWRTELSRALI